MKRVLDTWSTEHSESQAQQLPISSQNGHTEAKSKSRNSKSAVNGKEHFNTPFKNNSLISNSYQKLSQRVSNGIMFHQNHNGLMTEGYEQEQPSQQQIEIQNQIENERLRVSSNSRRNSKDRIKALLKDHNLQDLHKQPLTELHAPQNKLHSSQVSQSVERPVSQEDNNDKLKTQNWYANKLMTQQSSSFKPISIQIQTQTQRTQIGTVEKLKSILKTTNKSKPQRSKSRKLQIDGNLDDQQQLEKLYNQRTAFNFNGWMKAKQKGKSKDNLTRTQTQTQIPEVYQRAATPTSKDFLDKMQDSDQASLCVDSSNISGSYTDLKTLDSKSKHLDLSHGMQNSYSSMQYKNINDSKPDYFGTSQGRDMQLEEGKKQLEVQGSSVLQALSKVTNTCPVIDQLGENSNEQNQFQSLKEIPQLQDQQDIDVDQQGFQHQNVPKIKDFVVAQEIQRKSVDNPGYLNSIGRCLSDTPRNLETKLQKQQILKDNPLFEADLTQRSINNSNNKSDQPKVTKLIDSSKSMFEFPCTYQSNPLYDSMKDIKKTGDNEWIQQQVKNDMQHLIDQLSNNQECSLLGSQEIDVELIQQQVQQNQSKKEQQDGVFQNGVADLIGLNQIHNRSPQQRDSKVCEQNQQLEKQISLTKVIGHIEDTITDQIESARHNHINNKIQENGVGAQNQQQQQKDAEITQQNSVASQLQSANKPAQPIPQEQQQQEAPVLLNDSQLVFNSLKQNGDELVVYNLEVDKVKLLNERNKKQAKTLSKVLPQLRDLTQQAMIMYYLDHQYYLVQEDFQEAQLVQ